MWGRGHSRPSTGVPRPASLWYRLADGLRPDLRRPCPVSPDDEQALVERLRQGDADAFETLVRTQGGRMLAVARRLVGNDETARDVVQDALFSAFRSIKRFEGHSRLSTLAASHHREHGVDALAHAAAPA